MESQQMAQSSSLAASSSAVATANLHKSEVAKCFEYKLLNETYI